MPCTGGRVIRSPHPRRQAAYPELPAPLREERAARPKKTIRVFLNHICACCSSKAWNSSTPLFGSGNVRFGSGHCVWSCEIFFVIFPTELMSGVEHSITWVRRVRGWPLGRRARLAPRGRGSPLGAGQRERAPMAPTSKPQPDMPLCPTCDDEMELTVLIPPFGSPYGLSVYTCPKCGRTQRYLIPAHSKAA